MLAEHLGAGRPFTAAGIQSFLREEGTGPTVLCIHGMWGSSFLYRKVIRELAGLGLHGVAFDLPGLGLADRPENYDYSWSGLGRFAAAAVHVLQLKRFHLVVHDIGGPVGFELASHLPDRIASLTIFNTMIDVTTFNPPWSMRPFRRRGLGELWLTGMNKPMFRSLMRLQGLRDATAITDAELNAYLELMKGEDGGRSFLQIMRSTERTTDKEALYRSVVGSVRYPVQVVWAADDPALKTRVYGAESTQGGRTAHAGAHPRQALPARGSARPHGGAHRPTSKPTQRRVPRDACCLGAALPVHHALSGARRKDPLLLEYDVAIKPAMLD